MIGSNCCIKKDVLLKESIIDDYKKINYPANIDKKIVFSQSIISLDGNLVNTKHTDMHWLIEDIRVKTKKTLLEVNIEQLLNERKKNEN